MNKQITEKIGIEKKLNRRDNGETIDIVRSHDKLKSNVYR